MEKGRCTSWYKSPNKHIVLFYFVYHDYSFHRTKEEEAHGQPNWTYSVQMSQLFASPCTLCLAFWLLWLSWVWFGNLITGRKVEPSHSKMVTVFETYFVKTNNMLFPYVSSGNLNLIFMPEWLYVAIWSKIFNFFDLWPHSPGTP